MKIDFNFTKNKKLNTFLYYLFWFCLPFVLFDFIVLLLTIIGVI